MFRVQRKKNLQQKVKKESSLIGGGLFFVLTLMYTVAYNETLRAISILWYGVSALAIVSIFSALWLKRVGLRAGFYWGWCLTFFAFCIMSILWALKYEAVLNTLMSLFLIFVVNMLLVNIIRTREDLDKILFSNWIAMLLCFLYIIFTMDLNQIGSERIGGDTLGELWNANEIGLDMCIGFVCALYFSIKTEKKWKKAVFIFSAVAFVILAFLTGSRKAFLMVVIVGALIFWLKAKHRFATFLWVCGAAIIAFILVLKVDVLYNVLGERLLSMIKGFLGGDGGGSFDTRAEMIRLGFEWFFERPLLGYGLSNFSVLYQKVSGWATYSHNNFTEILVGLGIVGFLIYYSIYVYFFFKILKKCFIERDILAITLFSVNVSMFVLQTAMVSFYSTLSNCVLMLGMAYFNIREKTIDENSQIREKSKVDCKLY